MNLNISKIKSFLPIIVPGTALALAGVVALLVFWVIPRISGSGYDASYKFVAKRDKLVVTVVEKGSLKAPNSLDIKSEVEGSTTIKQLISEGTIITDEDVANKKVLVVLDQKSLTDKLQQQEVTATNAENSYRQAQENLTIQLKQNDSDIRAGQLKVKFAKMDLEKYLGEKLTDQVLQQLQAAQPQGDATQPPADQPAASPIAESDGQPLADSTQPDASAQSPQQDIALESIDFMALVTSPDLGGEALQQKRVLESDISLAKEQLSLSQNKLTWTKQLEAKGYVTRDELDADTLALEQQKVNVERTQTSLDLFIKYGFVKDAEQYLSNYREAGSEMERTITRTDSKKSQAIADKESKRRTMELEQSELEKVKDQIQKCTIVATKPGIVVYATGDMFHRAQNPIAEGASVRESQSILSLPDTTVMAVDVKVNEASFKKVKKDQRVRITVETYKDQKFTGYVQSVAPVPDSQNFFAGSDQTVYSTTVMIDGKHTYLKPGMTAEVEIVVNEIPDALAVPVQAIFAHDEYTVCYVDKGDYLEGRPVLLGEASESFVEIVKGLSEGETVLMREPKPNENVVYVKPNFTPPEPAAEQGTEGNAQTEQKPADVQKPPEAQQPPNAQQQPDAQQPSEGQQHRHGQRQTNGQQSTNGQEAQQPSGNGQGPPAMTDEQKARMKKLGEIMAKLTPEEQAKLGEKLQTMDRDARTKFFQKLAEMDPAEAEKYLRDNYLNQ